jgi:hypothetical protein
MADGNPSGRGQPQAPRLLPGRVHVPIQPAAIKEPRQSLFSPRAASGSSRASSPRSDPSPWRKGQNETTICRGYLSQADTHLRGYGVSRERYVCLISEEELLDLKAPDDWDKIADLPLRGSENIQLNIDRRQNYKGCIIEANPKELADGSGWTEDYNIELHYGARLENRHFIGQRTFPSKDEAIAACIKAGKQQINHSPLLRNR